MRGIRVWRSQVEPTIGRESRTDLDAFFGPVLPMLAGYAWVLEGALCRWPEDADEWYDQELDLPRGRQADAFFEYRQAVLQPESPWALWLALPGFLPRYGKYLVDDSCQIAGVPAPVSDPVGLLHLAKASEVDLRRLPGVEVYFENVDAAFWRFFSTRHDLIDTVIDHVRAEPGLRLTELDSALE